MKSMDAKHYLLSVALRRDKAPSFAEYPHAKIILLTEQAVAEANYTETEHYAVTREFLNKHEAMLKELLDK